MQLELDAPDAFHPERNWPVSILPGEGSFSQKKTKHVSLGRFSVGKSFMSVPSGTAVPLAGVTVFVYLLIFSKQECYLIFAVPNLHICLTSHTVNGPSEAQITVHKAKTYAEAPARFEPKNLSIY